MKTKFNAERQFIEGYDIVDPVDQATFQKQLEVSFVGNTATIDLSKSNFFLVDCELCSGSTCNFNIINYGPGVQRFEILLLESLEPKTLNFSCVDCTIHFPFKYQDEDGNIFDIEPMEAQRRNQMLITFRTTIKNNNSKHIVGATTPWFESAATHSMINIVVEETLNAVPDDESPEHDFKYRYPSNIQTKCKNSKNLSVIIDEGEPSFGVFSTFLYRIPDYYNDNECKHEIEIVYNGYNGGSQTIPLSKTAVNSGMVNIPIQLPNNFINDWEPSHGKNYNQGIDGLAFTDSAMFYREGDLVKYTITTLGIDIWRCNTDFPTGSKSINYRPGRFEPLEVPDPNVLDSVPWDYLYWDAWRNGDQGWGWYKMDIIYLTNQPNPVQWEYLDPQPSAPPL